MSLFQEGKFMLLNLLLNNFVPSSRMAARMYKGSSTVPVIQHLQKAVLGYPGKCLWDYHVQQNGYVIALEMSWSSTSPEE